MLKKYGGSKNASVTNRLLFLTKYIIEVFSCVDFSWLLSAMR